MGHSRSLSFRRYILTRKYHGGRGSDKGWAFVAYALGDPKLPNAASWQELRDYLVQQEVEGRMLEAADIVWRSYLSYVSRVRRLSRNAMFEGRSGTAAVQPSVSR